MTEEETQLTVMVFKKVQDLENEAELGLQGRLALCANLYGALIASIEHDLGGEKAITYAIGFAEYAEAAIQSFKKQIEARQEPSGAGIPISKAGEA